MAEGWIAISRGLTDARHELHPHATGESACRAWAWVDLIGYARWEDGGGLKRGQLRASENFLAGRWNWSRSRVHRFLADLEGAGRIRRLNSEGPREPNIISICNYETYQEVRTTNDTANGTANDTQEEQEQEQQPTTEDSSLRSESLVRSANGTDPALWMHDIWHEELGSGRRLNLTDSRRKKYRAMYEEQLGEAPDPRLAWRVVLRAVKKSDYHMSERSYQMPESILRNPDRRDTWVERTVALIEEARQKSTAASDFATYYRERREA